MSPRVDSILRSVSPSDLVLFYFPCVSPTFTSAQALLTSSPFLKVGLTEAGRPLGMQGKRNSLPPAVHGAASRGFRRAWLPPSVLLLRAAHLVLLTFPSEWSGANPGRHAMLLGLRRKPRDEQEGGGQAAGGPTLRRPWSGGDPSCGGEARAESVADPRGRALTKPQKREVLIR